VSIWWLAAKRGASRKPTRSRSIYFFVLNEWAFATGDDVGGIKIWDVRQQRYVVALDEHEDFIADFAFNADTNHLCAAGGDGYLSVWNLRKGVLEAMSDNLEDELLSCTLMKNRQRVVCGSQDGVLNIFTWGDFGDISDRFPGHPSGIGAMVKFDEDVVLTGANDGVIRVMNVFPNELVGVVGQHDLPLEELALSRERRLVASASHNHTVKFWNISYLHNRRKESDVAGEETGAEESSPHRTRMRGRPAPDTAMGQFFAEL